MDNPVGFAFFALAFAIALAYLPKFRRLMGWIVVPPIMVLMHYPKTRKPALKLLGALLVVAGILWARIEYKRRTDWYCDAYRNKDKTPFTGRKSDTTLTCYKGEDACRQSHEGSSSEGDAFLNEAFDMVDYHCSHSYASMWAYSYNLRLKDFSSMKVVEQFGSLQECQSGREEMTKNVTAVCALAR